MPQPVVPNDVDAKVRIEFTPRAAYLTALSQMGRPGETHTLKSALGEIAETVGRALSASAVAVLLYDAQVDAMRYTAGSGLSSKERQALSSVRAAGSPYVSTGQPVFTPALREIGGELNGFHAAFSAAIADEDGGLLGSIVCYFEEAARPTDAEGRLLEAYARRVADLVTRTRSASPASEVALRDGRRALQLRGMADAALALTAAASVDEVLRVVTEAAREIIGAHQAVTSRLVHGWSDANTYVSLSDKYAQYRSYDDVPKGLGVLNYVTRENRPLRLTGEELVRHPEWRGLRDSPGHPPLPNYLAAPLIARGGANLGLIQLSDKGEDEDFTAEDEAILVQLAQLASAAIENIELVASERTARAAAEAEAWKNGLLAAAARSLAGALTVGEALRAIARVTVPQLADWIAVHLVNDGAIELAHVAHVDPAYEARLREFLAGFPISIDQPWGAGAVIREGTSQLFPELPDEVLRDIAGDEKMLEELRALSIRTGICVPLRARGRTIGALSIVRTGGSAFDELGLDLAEQLGSRGALAIDNAQRYEEERRLATSLSLAIDAGRMGAWDWEIDSGRVHWSESLETVFGMEPGTFPQTFEAYAQLLHPEDRQRALDAVQRSLEDGTDHLVEHRIVRPDGEVRWLEGRGRILRDDDGRIIGMSGVAIDITDRKLAEERLRRDHQIVEALHHVGNAITSRLDLHEVVQQVTDAATSLTNAAFGAFFYNVVGDNGEAFMLYTLSGVPRDAFARFPMPRNTKVFDPTFRGQGVVRSDDVTKDPRYGQNPPYKGMPAGHLPVRSYLAVPVITSDGEVAGGLFFGHPEPARFGEEEERLATGIAAQAAIALENARLYQAAQTEIEARRRAFEERDHVARVLQQSLLPPQLPNIPGVEFAARYHPGTTDVGGDFYDVFPVRGRDWGIAIGDVCGKGPEAASLTALARHTMRTAAWVQRRPSQVLRVLNEVLHRSPEIDGRFCTAMFGRLTLTRSGARIVVTSGGHPPALVVRKDGRIERSVPSGTLLGPFPNVELAEQAIELMPGDAIVFYTDGVTDARDGAELFGEERLAALLASSSPCSADEIAGTVVDAAEGFHSAANADDIAVVVVRVPDREA